MLEENRQALPMPLQALEQLASLWGQWPVCQALIARKPHLPEMFAQPGVALGNVGFALGSRLQAQPIQGIECADTFHPLHGPRFQLRMLLDKYPYCRATNRLLQSWASLGLHVSQGHWRAEEAYATVCSADASLQGASQLIDGFFHADETLWRVFEKLAGKVGYRWYLWVFRSRSVCFFVLDPSRAAAVPLAHVAQLLAEAIVVCNRYSAYKKMARTLGILWAFCWAHVRRDFLELARGVHPYRYAELAFGDQTRGCGRRDNAR